MTEAYLKCENSHINFDVLGEKESIPLGEQKQNAPN